MALMVDFQFLETTFAVIFDVIKATSSLSCTRDIGVLHPHFPSRLVHVLYVSLATISLAVVLDGQGLSSEISPTGLC